MRPNPLLGTALFLATKKMNKPSKNMDLDGLEQSIIDLSDHWYEVGHSGDGLSRLEDEDIEELARFISSLLQEQKEKMLKDMTEWADQCVNSSHPIIAFIAGLEEMKKLNDKAKD